MDFLSIKHLNLVPKKDFGQKLNFSSKMDHKSIFPIKIEILAQKKEIATKNLFFPSNIEILAKKGNFDQKLICSSKI